MNLAIHIDNATLQKKMEDLAVKEAERIAANVVRSHFQGGNIGWATGLGYTRVKDQIEDMLLSDTMNDKIEDIIQRHWNTILEDVVVATLKRKAAKEAQIKLIGPGVQRIK